ncbi:hypothetical protein F4808DRAFT_466687 [Astrocystis sublimbata]|nr:hypothetical protein F4808DRAFT_466687 [Astrocystis sublimbata]
MEDANDDWAPNEQATGPEYPMIGYETMYDEMVDTNAIWGSSYGGAATPFNPMETDMNTDPVRDSPALDQASGQGGQQQPRDDGGAQGAEEGSDEDNWRYIVEVWPGLVDDIGDAEVAEHIYQVNKAFEKSKIDYHLVVQKPVSRDDLARFGTCRRYVLPRQNRDSERSRLQFLRIFSCDRSYNKALDGYHYKMSVAYESPRNPLPSRSSSGQGHHDDRHDLHVPGFNPLNPNGDPTLLPSSSPTPSTNSLEPDTPPGDGLAEPDIAFASVPKLHGPKGPPRMKPIPKPERQATKNDQGKFICTWKDCDAAVREFPRKCEWSKHMDKHERPYKCLAVGCENVPGFTYSGGLLRHEREVHRKHGGPKNPLYCPHKGCKRHKDSSFARLENLNEHLRRCHTPNEGDLAPQIEELTPLPKSTNNRIRQISVDASSPFNNELSPVLSTASPTPVIGNKRKASDNEEVSQENKRLKSENHELKRKIEAGHLQQSAMMEQIQLLENERDALIKQIQNTDFVRRGML